MSLQRYQRQCVNKFSKFKTTQLTKFNTSDDVESGVGL